MPLTLPVSQSSSSATHLDGSTAKAQETLHQNLRTDNMRTPKKRVYRHYRQRKCKYDKNGIGCPFDHPRVCLKLLKYGMDKKRGCRQGRHCRDLHPEMCNNSLYQGECLRENCRYMHVKGTVRRTKYMPNLSPETNIEEGRQTWSFRQAYEENRQASKPVTKDKPEAPTNPVLFFFRENGAKDNGHGKPNPHNDKPTNGTDRQTGDATKRRWSSG